MSDETTETTEVVEETTAVVEKPKEEKKAGKVADKVEKKDVEVSKNVGKILELIEDLKLMEVAELVKALEEEFGVTAAVPMMGAMPAGAGAEAGEQIEEKTAFNVELTASGEAKINVIKAIREVLPELGLKEAKDLVDGAPKMLKENVKKDDANNMKAKIEAAGGKVTLK